MLKYIGKRFIYMIITLFVIVTATFFLMQAAPGGPFSGERKLPPEINIQADVLMLYSVQAAPSHSLSVQKLFSSL